MAGANVALSYTRSGCVEDDVSRRMSAILSAALPTVRDKFDLAVEELWRKKKRFKLRAG